MSQRQNESRRNLKVVVPLLGILAGMAMLVWASVPLYQLFCQVTGYGGTTQRASASSAEVLDRTVTVRFDASTDPNLPWEFVPEQREITVNMGESGLAFFRATNNGSQPVVGTSTFNVTPVKTGQYFNKVQCFCFTEQVLQPGETMDFPVTFFVDPRMDDDRGLDEVHTITLSYTFFKAKDQTLAAAPNGMNQEEQRSDG